MSFSYTETKKFLFQLKVSDPVQVRRKGENNDPGED